MEIEKYSNRWFVVLVLHLCFNGSIFSQKSHLHLIDKFFNNRIEYSSLSYDVQLKMKTFSMEDTSLYIAKVELVKDDADTIFGGNLVLDLDSIWLGYNGKEVIKAFVDSSTLILADPFKYPGIYIQSTLYDELIDYGFLKNSTGLMHYIQDSIYQVTLEDSVLNGRHCLAITILLPDEEPIYNQSIFVALDTVQLCIIKRKYSAFFQENEQYSEWDFSDVKFHNEKSIAKLERENILKYNRIENYEMGTSRFSSMRNFDFAELTGKILNQDKYFRMDEIKSPFILLDFWYSACYPCIKSIPVVNELHRNYGDKGLIVYGVNLIDDENQSKSRLEKFINKNAMQYQSIMVNEALKEQIYIEGYPTLLLLDSHYRVIYREVGFSENLYRDVAEVLEARR